MTGRAWRSPENTSNCFLRRALRSHSSVGRSHSYVGIKWQRCELRNSLFLIFSLIDVYLNTACTIFLLICHSRLLSVLLLLQHSSIIHEVFSIPSHVTLGADLTTSSFEWSFIGRIRFLGHHLAYVSESWGFSICPPKVRTLWFLEHDSTMILVNLTTHSWIGAST
jgi:hypothetical protein